MENQILMHALKGNNKERSPIWLMRQAGRYLPTYRKLKEGRSLYEMFHTPELITQITLLPIDILEVDGAILFSDILTVLDGLGQEYHFEEKRGPVIKKKIQYASDLKLRCAKTTYGFLTTAIQNLKKELKVPLIGFAGAPFTVATYLIEEARSSNLKESKKWLFERPSEFAKLIDILTEATIDYLHVQIDAGVQAIQLFDSWANVLGLEEFRKWSITPMKKIIDEIGKRVPTIVFSRGSSFLAHELAKTGASSISVDFGTTLHEVRKRVGSNITLQGNLDPMVLYADRAAIATATDSIMRDMNRDPAFIFNLGHGLLPDIDPEKVKFLVDYVKEFNASCALS